MSNGLKKCPCCGGEADFSSFWDMGGEFRIYAYCVECHASSARCQVDEDIYKHDPYTAVKQAEARVVEIWNRRDGMEDEA